MYSQTRVPSSNYKIYVTDLELGVESESESVSEIACEQYMVTDKDCTGCTNVHNTI